jgi:hypothetical protein
MQYRKCRYRCFYQGSELTPTAVFPTQAVHIVEHVVAPKLQHWAKLPVVMRLSDVGQLMSSPIDEAFDQLHEINLRRCNSHDEYSLLEYHPWNRSLLIGAPEVMSWTSVVVLS